ncbi:Phosphoribosyl transferase [uncultured virus]|nr:Phosphoribosyl transferase [uncultured virus]
MDEPITLNTNSLVSGMSHFRSENSINNSLGQMEENLRNVPPEWKRLFNGADEIKENRKTTPKAVSERDVPKDWRLIVNSNEIKEARNNLASTISEKYQGKEVVLIGILTGGTYFLVDLSRSLSIHHSVHFIRASSYHNEQTSSSVDISGLSDEEGASLKGKHIILVDELYDSGHTLHVVSQFMKQYNPASVATCVMFRKRKSSSGYPAPDYCGLDDLPDVWFVGYGLDDCETKREWLNLWGVPKAPGVPSSPDDILFDSPDERCELCSQIKMFSRQALIG